MSLKDALNQKKKYIEVSLQEIKSYQVTANSVITDMRVGIQ